MALQWHGLFLREIEPRVDRNTQDRQTTATANAQDSSDADVLLSGDLDVDRLLADADAITASRA
jgi:hypothetical protein